MVTSANSFIPTHGPNDCGVRALVLEGLPKFIERQKKRAPGEIRILGSALIGDELFRAYLRYGSFDRFYLYHADLNADFLVRGTDSTESGRIRVITPATVGALRSVDSAAFVSQTTMLQSFVPLRRQLRRNWPIIGFIHALSDILTPLTAVALLTLDVRPGDAVICSSLAGKRALGTAIESALRDLGSIRKLDVPFELPVIPLGIDCDRFSLDHARARSELGIHPEAVVLLYMGRLTPMAKADLGPLLLCFRDLVEVSSSELLLIIAGDDTRHRMASKLLDYAHELGCSDRVVVKPDVSSTTKQQLYGAADIFIAPSEHVQETFGIALAEAMAAGLPIVASDWSGFREIVEHEVTGFLVRTGWLDFAGELELSCNLLSLESRNSLLSATTILDLEQLHHALLNLIVCENLRREMGSCARSVARARFDWKVVIHKHEELLKHLTQAARQNQAEFSWGLFSYDVQKLFDHYPSMTVPAESQLELTKAGCKWMTRHFPLTTLPDVQPNLDPSEIEVLLGHVQHERTTVSQAMQVMWRLEPLRARWVLGRLLKYGLLRLKYDGSI